MQSDPAVIDPILRLPAVRQLVPLSKGRLYSLIAQGRFPSPVAIGANSVGWMQSEVLAYRERVAAERALRSVGVRTRRGPAPKDLNAHQQGASVSSNANA